MPGRWGEMPFVALTLCLAAGICLSPLLTDYIFAGFAFAALTLIGGAWVALCRDRATAALSLGLLAIIDAGLVLALARRDAFPDADLRARLAHREISLDTQVPFDGCAEDDGSRREGEIVSTISIRALRRKDSWIPSRGKGILQIPDTAAKDGTEGMVSINQGDRVRGWATWHIPRNFQNPGASDHAGFLRRRGVFLQGHVKAARLLEVLPGDCLNPWTSLTVQARRRMRLNLFALTGSQGQNQAAILAAVTLGDYSGLSTSVREAFQNSGTYHVLVVSGLHVGWIAWVLIGLFRLLRFPTEAGRAIAAAGIFFYTSVVGFQASVSRSLWTFLLYLLGQVLFRRSPPANIALASAFLLLAVRPDWIFDAGFQLSFLSVLAICMMGVPIINNIVKPVFNPASHSGEAARVFLEPGHVHRTGRWLRTRCELAAEAAADQWHPWCGRILTSLSKIAARVAGSIAGMIIISASVQLWLEPLLAYHFNRLSWVAPVANLMVVPLSSLVLAAGLLSALAADLPLIAPTFLAFAGWLSQLLASAAICISGFKGGWQRCPTPSLPWVLAGILLVSAWCFMGWRRKWLPWVFIASVLFCLSRGGTPLDLVPGKWISFLRPGDRSGMSDTELLSLTFLDVGEGDSLVMRFPDARIWVLDAGGIRAGRRGMAGDHAFDIGEAVVSRYLWSRWITQLDRLILSHPDVDHGGGMPAIMKNFKIGSLEYGENEADPLFDRIRTTANERQIVLWRVQSGDASVVSGVGVEVMNPSADGLQRSTNEGSVVLRLSYGRFSALLTGDLERAAERELLGRGQNQQSLLLKVAHHGSRWATQDSFLERVRPRWAVLSAGRNNPFGHPSREVLTRLQHKHVLPLLTMDQGAITFATDGSRYVLATHISGIIQSGVLP